MEEDIAGIEYGKIVFYSISYHALAVGDFILTAYRKITVHIFRPNLTFGLFRACFWLQITFWVRAYVFRFGPVLVGPFTTLGLSAFMETFDYIFQN